MKNPSVLLEAKCITHEKADEVTFEDRMIMFTISKYDKLTSIDETWSFRFFLKFVRLIRWIEQTGYWQKRRWNPGYPDHFSTAITTTPQSQLCSSRNLNSTYFMHNSLFLPICLIRLTTWKSLFEKKTKICLKPLIIGVKFTNFLSPLEINNLLFPLRQ